MTDKQKDTYRRVTARIIERLSHGDIPWRQPWRASYSGRSNLISQKNYQGVNFLLLEPGQYLTFNQAKAAGGNIKKGAKASRIYFHKMFIPKDKKEEAEKLKAEGKDISKLEIPYFSEMSVFNVKDCEGLDNHPHIIDSDIQFQPAQNTTIVAEAVIDDWCNSNRLAFANAGDDCTYDQARHLVTVPEKTRFRTEEEYYGRVFQGLVKSWIAKAEENKKEPAHPEETAARNELICEIASSMILSDLGLERKESDDTTAALCQKWTKVLQNDFLAVVQASSKAEKAAREILGQYAH